MFREIVIPNNNEEEFIEVASRLGIRKLIFLYDPEEFDGKLQDKTTKLNGSKGLKIESGFMMAQKNARHAKKGLMAAKSSEKDRVFIEKYDVNLMFGLEEAARKDYLHQRASGLNQIMCELLRKKNIAVGFSYSSLFDPQSYTIIGRMMQNIRLCQKYKVKTVIGSFASDPYLLRQPHDIISLFSMLGMDSKRTRESWQNL